MKLPAEGLLTFGLLLTALAVSCARDPQYSPLPMGKRMVIMPTAQKSAEFPSVAVKDPKAIHLTISWSGAPIGSRPRDTLVKFYRANEARPFYEVKWSVLKLVYKDSKCTNEQISHLDGPLEAALICDGRLGPIEQLTRVELQEVPEGRSVQTKTFSTYRRTDEVMSLMIQAY